jgi:hypothetical protein
MEVRDPKLRAANIKIKYPRLLWQRCNKCNLEYRKTAMWRTGHSGEWEDYTWYCMECAPDYKDLVALLGLKGA